MNKTVNINLAGIVFHIDEDAYEKLSSYLKSIKNYVGNTEEHQEILNDVEARIAELLKEKTGPNKEVITNADVDFIISVMGKPEDFGDGSETSNTESNQKGFEWNRTYHNGKSRRVFRDGESKILGGVCSGIGQYFDFDPLWIRLFFVLLFFGFGTGFLFYLILWIVIPEAKTTAEKLEMKGEPIDFNNISKTVKEEAEQVKERFKNFSNEFKKPNSAHRNAADKLADAIKQVFTVIFQIFGKVVGLFFLFIGVTLLIGLISMIVGFGTVNSVNITEFKTYILGSSYDTGFLNFGLTLLIGIPVISLIYAGVKMLFRIKYNNKFINITLGLLWTAGFIICLYCGSKIGSEFAADGRMKEQAKLSLAPSDTLIVKLNSELDSDGNKIDWVDYRRSGVFNTSEWNTINKAGKKVIAGIPRIKIQYSESDSVEVLIVRTSNGSTMMDAENRASKIRYNYNTTGNTLYLANYYNFNTEDLIRDQELEVIIKVPKDKIVYLDRSIDRAIVYIDVNGNTTNEIYNYYAKSTVNGFECLGCPPHKIIKDEDQD